MNCKQTMQDLCDQIDDELSPRRQTSLAEHLTSCESCSRQAQLLNLSQQIYCDLDTEIAPAGFMHRVQRKLRQNPQGLQLRQPAFRRFMPYAIAATLLVVAGLVGFQRFTHSRPTPVIWVLAGLDVEEIDSNPAAHETDSPCSTATFCGPETPWMP